MKQKENIEDIMPLSPMQQGILFHCIKDKGSYAYFQQAFYRIDGPLDVECLKRAFELIVSRHGSLRSSFVYESSEQPLQVVVKNRTLDFVFYDLENSTVPDKDAFINEIRDQSQRKGFDLTYDTLFQIILIKVGARQYELVWNYHHLVMDGWCLSLLLQEFRSIYTSYVNGKPVTLPEAKPYSDYIRWLKGCSVPEAREYWIQYLSGQNTESPFFAKRNSREH